MIDEARSSTRSAEVTGTRLGEVLVLAWFFGLTTGLVYAAIMVGRQRILGHFTWMSRDVVWMAPVGHVLIFAVVGLPLWLLTRRARFGRRLAVGGFAFLTVFSLLLPFGQIALWASVLLALGVAIQTSRLYATRGGASRQLGAGALLLTGVVAAIGLGQQAWIRQAEWRTVAGLPTADQNAPNVLLVIWDTVRDDNLSLYGYSRPTTPALERWAGSGTVFERAIATSPWTLPTHGSLFTGLYPNELEADWRIPIPEKVNTLAETFRDNGYLTGGFVANLLYTSYESGLEQGFAHYEDYRLTAKLVLAHTPIGQTKLVQELARARSLRRLWRAVSRFHLGPGQLPGDQYVPATSITDAFLEWQSASPDRPFFGFLNYFDAHGPYRAPDHVRASLGLTDKPLDRYDAAIAYLDAEFDRLLGTLVERDVLENTIVVIVSDHGDLFGEHGMKGHANSLYLPLLRVPLLIRYPRAVPQGLRIATPISLRDVASTIAELAGVQQEVAVPGRPLTGAWSDSNWVGSPIVSELTRGINVDSTFLNAQTGLVSIVADRYHYIRNGFGSENLFDLDADPTETHDLAESLAGQEVIRRLRPSLDSVLARR